MRLEHQRSDVGGGQISSSVGAAIASPTALALVATTFAPGPVRNQAIAIFAAMTGIGSVTGLIIGGALTEVSWRWIFLINVPIGLMIIGFAFKALVETGAERLKLDVPGAILATVGCTGIVFGFTEGPEMGWTSLQCWVLSSAESRCSSSSYWSNARRESTAAVQPLQEQKPRLHVHFTRVDRCRDVFVGAVRGALRPGHPRIQPAPRRSRVRAFAFGLGAAAFVASKLAVRVQARWLIVTGSLLTFVGLLYGSTLDETTTYMGNLFVLVVGIGFGVGLAVVPSRCVLLLAWAHRTSGH